MLCNILRNILKTILLFSIILPCAMVQGSDLPEPHQWHDSTGQEIEAVFAGVSFKDANDQTILLRKAKDASGVEMRLIDLSKEDQKFIAEQLAGCRVITGKVVGISDGDTLRVLETIGDKKGDKKIEHRIRLGHIDSPEYNQPFGSKAKQSLSEKVFKQEVRVVWRERDQYKRILGDVYLGKRYINGEMIKDGFAWHYKKYSWSKALAGFEAKAKEAKRGLWADVSPIPPWDFRHKSNTNKSNIDKSNANKPDTSKPSQTSKDNKDDNKDSEKKSVTVYVTRTGTKYHRAGCRYLSKSSMPMPLEEAKKRYSSCKACKP